MKCKGLLSGLLATALVATLAVVPVSAATVYPDVADHWAAEYIADMTDVGLFQGYEDGSFRPETTLDAGSALALCARIMKIDSDTQTAIKANWIDVIEGMMGADQYWFHQEYAICLETGILGVSDLTALYTSGALSQPIAKENLAVYLIRAMQLEPMAQRLTSYYMGFGDVNEITLGAQPYVYLLNINGIVRGDEFNNFSPKLSVTRAVMSTMLSRVMAFMETRGTQVVLPDYTDYEVTQGTIVEATTASNGITALTMEADLAAYGDDVARFALSVDGDVAIYEDNMKSDATALKEGRHVRIALDEDGDPVALYVSAPLTTLAGDLDSFSTTHVDINMDSALLSYAIDRFTQVKLGDGRLATASEIDLNANYGQAVCKVDDQNRLVVLELQGGTRQESDVIFESVTTDSDGVTTLRVIGMDGVGRSYVVDESIAGEVSNDWKGSYVTLLISNYAGSVVSVDVDTDTQYIQGSIRSIATGPYRITINNLEQGDYKSYDVTDTCTVTYGSEGEDFVDLENGSFVTARLSGEQIVEIVACPRDTVREGTVVGRTFGSGDTASKMILTVAIHGSNITASYTVDLANLPQVVRDGGKTTIDKIRTGDEVEITARYNTVTKVDIGTPGTEWDATIESILKTSGGYTLHLVLTNGEKVSYTVAAGLSAIQDGEEIPVADLDVGQPVGLMVSGDEIIYIEAKEIVNTAKGMDGTVAYVNSSDRYMLLRVTMADGTEESVTVELSTSTTILDATNGGKRLTITGLKEGMNVECKGGYENAVFEATIVIVV